jgi:predicted NAD/FAD-binding protein
VRAANGRAGRRVAVVGAGVSGLTAAFVLQRSAAVTLFEAEPRLGGHADTHDVTAADGRLLGVDTGFIVHNARTYPTLLRLFADLGIATQDSDMSMSVHCDGCGLEYAGARGLRGLFPSVSTFARGRYVRMLGEVLKFHRAAHALLASPPSDGSELTLAQFLRRGGYTPYFIQHFVTPIVSCVWSCAPGTALDYPARYLFEFLDNHGLLAVTGSPTWRTVVGGSRTYVEAAAKGLTAVETGTPVRAVTRIAGGVEIRDDADQITEFDAVVVATHPRQALSILSDPTPGEQAALRAFSYSLNPTVLHTDRSLLPRRPGAAASWNYRLDRCATEAGSVLVSYDMTRLQRLDTDQTFVVTLNPGEQVRPDSVIARMSYEHPIYTPGSVAAQRLLPALNDGVVAFAGAYHGWGFHEDGARSGLAAAESLGGSW